MARLQDIMSRLHAKIRRNQNTGGSRTLLARDALAFHAYYEDAPPAARHLEHISRTKESSLNGDFFQRKPEVEIKGDRYQHLDKEEDNGCQRPSCATVLLIALLMLVFVGLPVVYLLHCFDVLTAHWAAEQHEAAEALLMKQHHATVLKESVHYAASSAVHEELNRMIPDAIPSSIFTTDVPVNKTSRQLVSPPKPKPDQCVSIQDADKFDCYPEYGANESGCEARGCCWIPRKMKKLRQRKFEMKETVDLDIPYCFYPKDYGGYELINVTEGALGKTAYLERTFKSPYPNDIKTIRMDVMYESEDRVRVKIVDPLHHRFEPPYPEVPMLDRATPSRKYIVDINPYKVGFRVIRRENNATIFNSQSMGALIFSDQLLQLSGQLLANTDIYGLGEHQAAFRLDMNWQQLTLFNADQAPVEHSNLYGTQPLYLAIEPTGHSHGVFLLNSNAMDVILQPSPAVTFRPIGGVLDFYFLLGPTPQDVVRQYTNIVGRPFMPPLWGLGFHLCRFGTKTLNRTKEIWERTRNANIPFDVQWNDLDYMKENNDFTYDNSSFSGLPEFVHELHGLGMHWIPLIDSGISAGEPAGTYPPFDEGISMDIFIKDSTGKPFVGKVWNRKATVWPDFTHPRTVDYWTSMLRILHSLVQFDGAWIDMNEPSNFFSGTINGCPKSTLEDPPYVPNVNGGILRYRTVCMTARHYAGNHYDVHNLYGFTEAIITSFALAEIRGKRPFVISRSTFPGHGHYAGHWSGDVYSTWHDLRMSIQAMLSFNIFGIPLVGADICGFNGNTTVELCARWSQLGAFYPFSRNHNTDDAIDQDPVALGDVVVQSAKKALLARYSLLPYLYTLFWKAHTEGTTVATPLFFEFPNDIRTHSIEEQFFWGTSLMIVPVLQQGATEVTAYLPAGTWFDFYTGRTYTNSSGADVILNAPIDTIPLLVRSGTVLPMQEPGITVKQTMANPARLLVALDDDQKASGEAYYDDGDSLNAYEEQLYSQLNITVENSKLSSASIWLGYKPLPILDMVTFYGLTTAVSSVQVNDEYTQFSYDTIHKVLIVDKLNISLEKSIVISWK